MFEFLINKLIKKMLYFFFFKYKIKNIIVKKELDNFVYNLLNSLINWGQFYQRVENEKMAYLYYLEA